MFSHALEELGALPRRHPRHDPERLLCSSWRPEVADHAEDQLHRTYASAVLVGAVLVKRVKTTTSPADVSYVCDFRSTRR
jgi:hypothetical protein